MTGFSDAALDLRFDEVSSALVASRCLSLAELDDLTDELMTQDNARIISSLQLADIGPERPGLLNQITLVTVKVQI